MIGMCFYKFFKFIGRTTVGKRTTGICVGYQNFFLRRKNFCCFTHKMHAAQYYDICIGLCSPLRKRQTIPHYIGYILNISCLIVMRHNYGIFFFFQPRNFFY